MRRRLVRNLGFLAVFAAGVGACSTTDFVQGAPLDLTITTNAPVGVVDSLALEYEVVGRSLLGLVVAWGDAEVDSLVFSGAQSAAGIVRHQYATSGSFTVTAKAVDAVEGSLEREITVAIEP